MLISPMWVNNGGVRSAAAGLLWRARPHSLPERKIQMLNAGMVQSLVKEADDMGLIFAGVPRERMLVELYDVRDTMREEMVPILGEFLGNLVAEAFVTTVARRAAEFEAAALRKGNQ